MGYSFRVSDGGVVDSWCTGFLGVNTGGEPEKTADCFVRENHGRYAWINSLMVRQVVREFLLTFLGSQEITRVGYQFVSGKPAKKNGQPGNGNTC